MSDDSGVNIFGDFEFSVSQQFPIYFTTVFSHWKIEFVYDSMLGNRQRGDRNCLQKRLNFLSFSLPYSVRWVSWEHCVYRKGPKVVIGTLPSFPNKPAHPRRFPTDVLLQLNPANLTFFFLVIYKRANKQTYRNKTNCPDIDLFDFDVCFYTILLIFTILFS